VYRLTQGLQQVKEVLFVRTFALDGHLQLSSLFKFKRMDLNTMYTNDLDERHSKVVSIKTEGGAML
jgi:hypothetical protein